MTDITLATLTEAKLDGAGVFDVLMKASKAHLDDQFHLGRIKGPEYSQVYLGQLQSVLQTALTFITEQQKINLEAQLLTQQIELTKAQVLKAQADVEVAQQEVETAKATVLLTQAQVAKAQQEALLIPAQILQVEAQTRLTNQQADNAVGDLDLTVANTEHVRAETTNLAKQGQLIDSQIAQSQQQVQNLAIEALNLPKQGALLDAQAGVQGQQKLNLIAEAINIPKQGALVDAQTQVQINSAANEVLQGKVLVAQECLLRAQFDEAEQNVLQVGAQTSLLNQKLVTEKAQTMALGVDEDSVVGRQKNLYLKQATGFDRDAEQKVAKIFADTWNARRMTDDGVQANSTNLLDDPTVGRAMTKLLAGVNA